jgi:hypothetical protein
MIKAKRVRIMAEHGCDGLWNDGGVLNNAELAVFYMSSPEAQPAMNCAAEYV